MLVIGVIDIKSSKDMAEITILTSGVGPSTVPFLIELRVEVILVIQCRNRHDYAIEYCMKLQNLNTATGAYRVIVQ
jgi:hypothetical protein